MLQATGNLLTIAGIVVTLTAYFGQHSRVTLADLEPGLTDRWHRTRHWVRRRLGRSQSATIGLQAVLRADMAMSGRAFVWTPIQPGDDIAVRAEKLARNLERVRDEVHRARHECETNAREAEQRLTSRLREVEQVAAERHEASQRATTAAMRWEVRGLLVTLVGAGMSVLGG